jgi:hypothetical protein
MNTIKKTKSDFTGEEVKDFNKQVDPSPLQSTVRGNITGWSNRMDRLGDETMNTSYQEDILEKDPTSKRREPPHNVNIK